MKLRDAKTAKLTGDLLLPFGEEPANKGPVLWPKKRRRGRPKNPAIARTMKQKRCSRRTATRKLAKQRDHRRSLREKVLAAKGRFSSVIKPDDSWNFNPKEILYPKLDEGADGYGYIPGDLYANCLYYWARSGDLVVAPMAGSGMIQHVYEDRALWTKGLPQPWDIELRMFDLTPRGRYAALIGQWDMTRGFPPVSRRPDYVVMDIPYFGMCGGQYSSKAEDIANLTDIEEWTEAMRRVARGCAEAEARRCTVLVSNWVDSAKGEQVLCAEIIRDLWRAVGYRLERVAYASKRIQSARRDRMALLNTLARENRMMLSDMTEVLTFGAD